MIDPERGGLLGTLARIDRTRAFLAALALGLLGLFLPGALGAVILYAVVAALAVLLRHTWVITPPGQRVFRVVVLAGLVVIATTKII
jgi:hypothetical protein